jgi:hypothetical protein
MGGSSACSPRSHGRPTTTPATWRAQQRGDDRDSRSCVPVGRDLSQRVSCPVCWVGTERMQRACVGQHAVGSGRARSWRTLPGGEEELHLQPVPVGDAELLLSRQARRGDEDSGDSADRHVLADLSWVFAVPIPVIWLIWVGHLIVSYRRASDQRREQLKWLTGDAVALLIGLVISASCLDSAQRHGEFGVRPGSLVSGLKTNTMRTRPDGWRCCSDVQATRDSMAISASVTLSHILGFPWPTNASWCAGSVRSVRSGTWRRSRRPGRWGQASRTRPGRRCPRSPRRSKS